MRNPSSRRSTLKVNPRPTTTRVKDGAIAGRVRKSTRFILNPAKWDDPKSSEWDVLRVLYLDECLAPDSLLKMPPPNYSYITAHGRLKDPLKFDFGNLDKEPHPKLATHLKNGTATRANRLYYKDMPHNLVLPIAGIIREDQESPNSLVKNLPRNATAGDYPFGIFPGLSRAQYLTSEAQEDGFHARPSIKLVIPDHIKAILVDDWENVTKNQQLVPLPSAHPVNSILNDYLEFEMPKRLPGSAHADILEEVVAGLKEYFEKCLGRILLYR